MDQKNTIVKCEAHPNCLFNHNGVCDNYVITIGEDGKCQCYVETADERVLMCEHCDYYNDHGLLQNPCDKRECYMHRKENACIDFKVKRGLRAKGSFLEDSWVDSEIVEEVCKPFLHKCDTKCRHWQLDSYSEWVCNCMADNINPHGECPHYSIDEVISMKFKVTEFDKPNKNKSIVKKNLLDEPFDEEYEALFKPNKNKSAIKDIVPECDLPVCDWSCKHALRSGPSFNPELWCDIMKQKPAVGLFCSNYEEEK